MITFIKTARCLLSKRQVITKNNINKRSRSNTMTRIVFIALAGLALFATAAAAHQNGRGNNQMRGNRQMQQTGYTGGGCLMNSNMVGRGMMNGNLGKMGPGIRGDATPGAQTNNWRTNPSYLGQVDDTTTTGK